MIQREAEVTGWDPFAELRGFQYEMGHLLDRFAGEGLHGPSYPALNGWSNEEQVIVTAELPGVRPSDMEIDVLRDQLTIKGDRKPESLGEGEVCHRSERPRGKFSRTIRLPFEIEAGKVVAEYEHGVLRITLPRAEATKPRKIAIATETDA